MWSASCIHCLFLNVYVLVCAITNVELIENKEVVKVVVRAVLITNMTTLKKSWIISLPYLFSPYFSFWNVDGKLFLDFLGLFSDITKVELQENNEVSQGCSESSIKKFIVQIGN